MIRSFGNKTAKDIYNGIKSKEARRLPLQLHGIAYRKLDYLRRATRLDDLRSPPGNHLEPLKGNLKGYHSIRINEQYRIVFQWIDNHAEQVMIMDYH